MHEKTIALDVLETEHFSKAGSAVGDGTFSENLPRTEQGQLAKFIVGVKGTKSMDSWWELGEGFGYEGNDLQVWRITCPFCGEKGHFCNAFHGEKKKPQSNKCLNFEVLKCTNCTGFVHVLWSSSEHQLFRPLYDFRVLPLPLAAKPEPSENWPKGMRTFWVQAHDSITNENWDAAAVMARSALQFVVRERGAEKGTLNTEIQDLASKGILVPIMEQWSHEVRLLGRDSAHPELLSFPANPEDARDIVKFLDFLLLYLYDLPKEVNDYRTRKNPPSVTMNPE